MTDEEGRPVWAARLKAQREVRMWSKPRLARELFHAAGVPDPAPTQVQSLARQIRSYENGDFFPRDWADAYAVVFGRSSGELFSEGRKVASQGAADRLRGLCRSDLISDLDGMAAVAGDEFLDTVEPLLVLSDNAVIPVASVGAVSLEHVRQVEAATEVFRGWDNQFGGGLRRKAVVGQLSELVPLLEGPFDSPAVGQRLFAAVADLTQLAGFMSFDVRLHGAAQRYFTLGLRLAKESGDRLQAARMLYCLARQMIELGEPRSALDLAQSGTYVIRRTGNFRVAAMMQAMQGRAYAGMGDADGCRRSLDRAAEDYESADANIDPAWVAFFSSTELQGLNGVALRDLALCHHELGDSDRARAHAEQARPHIARAAAGRQTEYLRSRVLDLDGLAVTHVLAGDPKQAAAVLHQALDLAAPVNSARLRRNFGRTLKLASSHYGEQPEIQDLHDRARIEISLEPEG